MVKKTPLTADIIKSVIEAHAYEGASLKDLRIATLCTLGFAGFFCFKELSNVQANHIELLDTHIKIFVPHSKTDVYRQGNYVDIARTHSNYCAVALLNRYLTAARIEKVIILPIFRPLTKKKSGYALRKGCLSYTRCRKIFKETLSALGYDASKFGLHSLRSGGITSFVKGFGSEPVPERLESLRSTTRPAQRRGQILSQQ